MREPCARFLSAPANLTEEPPQQNSKSETRTPNCVDNAAQPSDVLSLFSVAWLCSKFASNKAADAIKTPPGAPGAVLASRSMELDDVEINTTGCRIQMRAARGKSSAALHDTAVERPPLPTTCWRSDFDRRPNNDNTPRETS